MVVLLAPSYAGYNGGNEGWYQEMKDERHHETAQLRALSGTAIRRLHHIIWVQGGDYNVPNKALVDGDWRKESERPIPMRSRWRMVPRRAVVADYWSGYNWMAINAVYTLFVDVLAVGHAVSADTSDAVHDDREHVRERIRREHYHAARHRRTTRCSPVRAGRSSATTRCGTFARPRRGRDHPAPATRNRRARVR